MNAPKIHTDVLWDLTILFGCIAILYFTAIFFFRNKITGKSKKVTALKTELSPMISEFIFYDDTASKEEKSLYINLKVQIRDMLRDDFTRKVVSEILLDLRKDVSGSAKERLFGLFQDLDLHKRSYKKLDSWRWENISSGIQELTRMEVNDSYEFITKFINDKRSTIRKQAEIGVVTLNPEGINYFLDTTTHRISEWQQLKLIEVLSNKTGFEPPSFMAWLTSRNKFVVLFALRLIKYYDQNDAEASIIELVKHRNDQIKEEAIHCIKAFYLQNALPILKRVFWSCATDLKISILGAIGELGTKKDIPFLKSIENREGSYAVTSKALSAINAIAPESILPTRGIADVEDLEAPFAIVVDEPVVTEVEEEIKGPSPQEEVVGTEPLSGIRDMPIAEAAQADESETKNTTEVASFERVESQERPVEDTMGDNREIVSDSPSATNNSALTSEDIRNIEVVYTTDSLSLGKEATNEKSENEDKTMEPSINDIEVEFEEIVSQFRPEMAKEEEQDIHNIAVVAIPIDFLPIVVADEVDESESSILLNDIIVYFEPVAPSERSSDSVEIIDLEEFIVDYQEIEFVPIKEDEKDVHTIDVFYEEVLPETAIELDQKALSHENFEIEVVFANNRSPLNIPKKDSLDLMKIEVDSIEIETLCSPLNELEVICEIVQDGEEDEEDLPQWLLDEIASENTHTRSNTAIEMEGPEWEGKEAGMMDKITAYLDLLPKSEEYPDQVNEPVQLLDNIALFGDEREIPLLQELMEKEDKAATKQRIDALMRRFMGTDVYGVGKMGMAPYSVFEELFRNCDTESKLILLDEIVSIGDRKEIYFLEQLVNDPNKKISEKAKASLSLIEEKVDQLETGQNHNDAAQYESLLSTMELDPPKDSDIFDIDFELIPQETEVEKQSPPKKSRWATFIAKLIKKPIK